jgi:hypothetical protein
MARQEDDREDLIEEAVALVHRLEIRFPERDELLVAGRRATGAWSFYFGSEPVYQFDPEGRLRRAFVDGRLYRTQGTTLARLTRVRTADETFFDRHDLTADELAAFLKRCLEDLRFIRKSLWNDRFEILRYIGFDAAARSAISDALHTILLNGIRLGPAIPARKV